MGVSRIVVATALTALAAGAAATPSQAASCGSLPVKASLSSADPTVFRGAPSADVRASGKTAVSGLRVAVMRKRTVYASGRLSGTLPRARRTVVRMRTRRSVAKGAYTVALSGTVNGCTARRTTTWKFGNPTLPVRATPASTLVGDNVTAVRLFLRGVGDQRTAQVDVALFDSAHATVAEAPATLQGGSAVVDLPLASPLQPGRYVVHLAGSAPGVPHAAPADQEIVFGPGGRGAPVVPQGNIAKAVVDWSGGMWQGREGAGFVAPGIGHGEIVCRPDAQYIRFYPDDLGRETAMMNWTYRDWGGGTEKALREAVYTLNTGPSISEGLNKFSPIEATSTGEFDGIISDRGPFATPGGPPLAPPTTLKLTWEWDLSTPGQERCHVDATFTSQVNEGPPSVGSAQVVWRGDGSAPGRDTASVAVPGAGTLQLSCQAGEDGSRLLTLDAPQGGTVLDREASDDAAATWQPGRIERQLPNNGMLWITLAGGQTVMVTSRYKTNDPDPAQNWCAVSAQAVA